MIQHFIMCFLREHCEKIEHCEDRKQTLFGLLE